MAFNDLYGQEKIKAVNDLIEQIKEIESIIGIAHGQNKQDLMVKCQSLKSDLFKLTGATYSQLTAQSGSGFGFGLSDQ